MNRYKARESAFILIFEKYFNDEPISELIECAKEVREMEDDEFMVRLVEGTFEHIDEIDAIIEKKCIGWKIERLSKVSLAAMRLCCYEMMYEDDIPISVSIDQAVELTKKYGVPDDGTFINGVLGGVADNIE